MARVRSFRRFVAEFSKLTEDEFFARVTEPHLYFTDSCENLTELFKTVVSTKTPSGPLPSPLSPSRMSKQGILPLRKGRTNAFSLMVTLGRAENNDLVVHHDRISKFHCYFRKLGAKWTVTDANSTNGTTVDGVRIAPERTFTLRSGVTIELSGSLRALFLEPEALWDLLCHTRGAVLSV
jgi:hypothetical protein